VQVLARMLIHALRAMKHQEKHTEGIKRSHENA
jgi:hypothetical protein